MNIHVLGVGSIGSLIAAHLRFSTSYPITLLVKRDSFAQTLTRDLEQTIVIEREGSVIRATGFSIQLTDPAAEIMRTMLRGPNGKLRANILRPRSRSPSLAIPTPNEETSPIDSLIITTKAPSTWRAVRALSSRLTPNSTITLIQNGMGVYEQLCAKVFPSSASRPHFIIASTTHGAWAKRPFYTVHAGLGDLVFGVVPSERVDLPLDLEKNYREIARKQGQSGESNEPTLEELQKEQEALLQKLTPHNSLYQTIRALLSLRGLSPSWVGAADLQERLQRKLVTNSVINPLTAIMGCRNGKLAGDPGAQRIARGVCQEAEKVFRAQLLEDENYTGSSNTNPPQYTEQDLANANLSRRLIAKSLEAEFVRVAELTAVNISSMLQDVKNGVETEVDYMNGYLIRMGVKYGIPTPVNEMLRTLVQIKTRLPGGEEM
ncbi:2-dehydropantoate 2-reductase [Ceratobasidium theobromae]|uniref:2-dehydropantoate 2-reductase n=1 Tax=Ceratobasidium theobromae TaxID=1582974 RepID=A0A5N5QHW3_9AGAM|nr:2-dehydropantoate 2-reductase [Ceratobasidium theobromae]